MKKYTLTALAILSAATLSAQTQEVQQAPEAKQAPEVVQAQFSSFGSHWIELDMGANTYSHPLGNDTGFAMAVEGNFAAYSNDIFGIDVGLSATYGIVEIEKTDMETGGIAIEIKPYVNIVKTDSVAIKYFLNPYIGYQGMEKDNGAVKQSQDYLISGIRTGFEIAFLQDFNASIAYRYQRSDADKKGEDLNSDILEIGAGYRMTESISLHLKYAHVFEQNEIHADNVLLGLRYTF